MPNEYVEWNELLFNGTRLLPCGNVAFVKHIDAMVLKTKLLHSKVAKTEAETTLAALLGTVKHQRSMFICDLCHLVHVIDDITGFPKDTHMPLAVDEARFSAEHVATIRQLNACSEHLRHAYVERQQQQHNALASTNANPMGFVWMREAIEADRCACLARVHTHYDALISQLNEIATTSPPPQPPVPQYSASEQQLEQTLLDDSMARCESELRMIKLELPLYAFLDSVVVKENASAVWTVIRRQCERLLVKMDKLSARRHDALFANQQATQQQHSSTTRFEAHEARSSELIRLGRLLDPLHIESLILTSAKRRSDLRALCGLGEHRALTLVYRASRDGFSAASYRAKCDSRKAMLAVIETTRGYVFGGYISIPQQQQQQQQDQNGNMEGPLSSSSFTFSLINAHGDQRPRIVPCRSRDSMSCESESEPLTLGPGSAHAIHVASESNANWHSELRMDADCASMYAHDERTFSYACAATRAVKSVHCFQTSEIECFQLVD